MIVLLWRAYDSLHISIKERFHFSIGNLLCDGRPGLNVPIYLECQRQPRDGDRQREL